MTSNRTYLVTGASGFVGRALISRLLADGHRVRAVVRGQPTRDWELTCDLAAPVSAWEKAIDGCDGVFHLAWSTVPGTANSAPLDDLNTNVVGTVRMLEALRGFSSVPLVFASSGGTVYGVPREVPIQESHPLRPMGVYGAAKACAEQYLMAYRRQWNVDARVLRLSNPYGPGQNVEGQLGAATVFAWRAVTGAPINIWGNGSIVRDFVYIGDTVEAFIAMMNASRSVWTETEPVVNIGSGHGVSIIEIIRVIEELMDTKLDVTYHPSRTFDLPINVLDVSLAKRLLDWSPSTRFSDGMTRMLDNLKARV
ncbi:MULTISPECIES: NAD-dependent epimerase/dehydratase family protein [unclassified Caballeronia]|uniref:NAD-dependent epimerase/dehydratase family protein n=1 Tax=unclassified Caballeronia TaxID=2646786 RepID=UPI002027924A|nr:MULTISPECIES: NAD-dependent epimerase/dehydratase family protein [unclassified Caballeronia]